MIPGGDLANLNTRTTQWNHSLIMDNFADLFNAVATAPRYNKTLKLEELDEKELYSIQSARIVNTKYGKSVVLTLCEPNSEDPFDVFLPKRYVEVFEKSRPIPENIKLIRGKMIGNSFNLQVKRK